MLCISSKTTAGLSCITALVRHQDVLLTLRLGPDVVTVGCVWTKETLNGKQIVSSATSMHCSLANACCNAKRAKSRLDRSHRSPHSQRLVYPVCCLDKYSTQTLTSPTRQHDNTQHNVSCIYSNQACCPGDSTPSALPATTIKLVHGQVQTPPDLGMPTQHKAPRTQSRRGVTRACCDKEGYPLPTAADRMRTCWRAAPD